jgi:hypothetical protein
MLPTRDHAVPVPMDSVIADVSEETSADPDDADVDQETGVLPRSPALGPMEYIVPLPMVDRIRELYEATVVNYQDEIRSFVNDDIVDAETVSKMDTMINTLKKLSDHQDIMFDASSTQINAPDEINAGFAITISTKCLFLREFLDAVRSLEVHIAILSRPGQMMDILESLLRANEFNYSRLGEGTGFSTAGAGALRVTLLATGNEGPVYVVDRAAMVIAFDDTFRSSDRYTSALRAGLYDTESLAPLVSLVVTNSAEHLDICIPQLPDPLERKMILVSSIAQTVRDHDVGKFLAEEPSPFYAAAAVATYLENGGGDSDAWPLPPITEITSIEVIEPVKQSSGSTTQSDDPVEGDLEVPHSSLKRVWVSFHNGDHVRKLMLYRALKTTSGLSQASGYAQRQCPSSRTSPRVRRELAILVANSHNLNKAWV